MVISKINKLKNYKKKIAVIGFYKPNVVDLRNFLL